MPKQPSNRYFIVAEKDSPWYVIVDSHTGQHLTRVEDPDEALRLRAIAEDAWTIQQEQELREARARASGRPQ